MPSYSELLDAAKSAYLDVLTNGQHIGVAGKVYTKADLADLQKQIEWLEKKVVEQAAGGIFGRMKTGVPYRA